MPTEEEVQKAQRETFEMFLKRVQQVVKDSGENATAKDTEMYVRATVQALSEVIAEHKYLSIQNAFSLVPVYHQERTGHNPQDPGSTLTIPAGWKYKIKLSKALKDKLNA